jgi:uncharacterized membrane protein (DUF485 family)
MSKFECLILGVLLLYISYTVFLELRKSLTAEKVMFNVVLFSILVGFGLRLTLRGLGIYNPRYTQ